jgi:hypothetical protein
VNSLWVKMPRKALEGHGRGRAEQALYVPADRTIAAFVTELHFARGRSARTCEAYARDLEFFARFIAIRPSRRAPTSKRSFSNSPRSDGTSPQPFGANSSRCGVTIVI